MSKENSNDEEFKNQLNLLSQQSKKNAKILISLFLTGALILTYIIYTFPELELEEKLILFKLPRSPEDYRNTSKIILKYTESHFYKVFFLFVWLYVFLQAFAIPGPIILSVLSGALYGRTYGFLLVCCCATLGASGCYLLSNSIARYFIFKAFPNRVIAFKHSVDENKNNLFYYMLFLRITPLFPNWSINLASPVVGVPFKYFFFATFLGLMPANIMHCHMGSTLATLDKIGFDYKIILALLLLGFLALLPIWIKKKFANKFKTD